MLVLTPQLVDKLLTGPMFMRKHPALKMIFAIAVRVASLARPTEWSLRIKPVYIKMILVCPMYLHPFSTCSKGGLKIHW